MKDFKNKVAVITGAGSGMGRELAIELASAGANIALVEVNEETLNETADFLKKYNVGVSKHVVDVGNKQAIFDLPEKVIFSLITLFLTLTIIIVRVSRGLSGNMVFKMVLLSYLLISFSYFGVRLLN